MSSIVFLSSIISLTISISDALVFENNPIILVRQGVIEDEGVLPISIFWDHPNITKGDKLKVYSLNPWKESKSYLTLESYTGVYELPHSMLKHAETPDKYCVVIFSKDGILDNNPSCESKVQWMYDRRDLLRDFRLIDLIIPGTHQSAAYLTSNNNSLDDTMLLSDWIFCQTKSIKSQLMNGIRYLDLRPGYIYVDGKKKYITTHSVFNLISMDDVVQQINEFMELSKDIVIVSFKEFFKGFNSDEDHLHFINYLEQSFERHAQSVGHWMYELEVFWATDKRLILSYDHAIAANSKVMWPEIKQHWANAQTITRLHSYLNTLHRNATCIIEPYAAMVEFTPSFTTVTEHISNGGMSLRHSAERIGRFIPEWYTGEWAETANIIAVDFYQTSGIVDLAIQLNERRTPKVRYDEFIRISSVFFKQ